MPRNPGDVTLKPDGSDDDDADTAVCYKEGFAVREMYQMCDVTSELSARNAAFLFISAPPSDWTRDHRPQDPRHVT